MIQSLEQRLAAMLRAIVPVFGLCTFSLIGGCNSFDFGPGEVDQDPGTQFAEVKCITSHYDENYSYGFDLPAEAESVRTKNESNSLTNAFWTLEDPDGLVQIMTRVQAASSDSSLETSVRFANNLAMASGADVLAEDEVVLSNGRNAIQSITQFDGLTTLRVQDMVGSRMFTLEAIVDDSARTPELYEKVSAIVLSLCIDK
jgi:hypothetical protein